MSFMSMLQMAKGKDPPPEPKPKPVAKPALNNVKSSVVKPHTPNTSPRPSTPRPVPQATKRTPPTKVAKPASKLTAGKIPAAQKAANKVKSAPPPPREPLKRISFKDAMKQATTIDKKKLEITLKVKDSRKEKYVSARIREQARKASLESQHKETTKVPNQAPTSHKSPNLRPNTSQRAPAARPNAELMAKYQAKKAKSKRTEDDDESLSDFVASDDENEDVSSTIWSMFNRRPREEYMDSGSDDDMEATGSDIFNEERRSALQAKREDAEEERKLEELARKKAKRFA